MKKNMFFIAAGVCLSVLAGCYNLRTDVTQPISEQTTGEWIKCRFFGCHDCRESADSCSPICKDDLAKLEKTPIVARENWKKFKQWHISYVNAKDCYELNRIGKILENLSNQFKYQCVIPLIELDSAGLLSCYKHFMADVAILVEAGCDKNAAMTKVYLMWQEKYGTEACEQLKKAIPFIRQMQADKQLQQVFVILLPEFSKVMIASIYDSKALKRISQRLSEEVQTPAGWLALAQYVCLCNEVRFGIQYVSELKIENAKEVADVEAALKQIESQGEK